MSRNDEESRPFYDSFFSDSTMSSRNNESQDDFLAHASALFGDEPIEDDENIIYGPLTLSTAPKASLSLFRS